MTVSGRDTSLIWALRALVMLTILAGLERSASDDCRAAVPPAPLQLQMAHALRAATRPGEMVVADDQYVAGLAGRTVPAQLVDTSQVRIVASYRQAWYRSPWSLTAGQVERLMTRAQVRVILFASGRFDLVPGLRAWVDAHFQPVARFGDGRTLYRGT